MGLLCQHQRDWEVQGVPQSIWAVVPVCEHCTHHGTWHSRGCPSWQGWRRRMGGTPGAGSASPPTGEQKEGLSTRVGGQQLLRAHWVSELPSHHSQSPGDWHSGAFPSPGAALGWHTHHTPAQDTLHFPKGGHRRVPALVVEVPAAPEAARPRRVCLHGVSQLRDTPLWGCRRGHWEMPACGIASGAHRSYAGRMEGRRGVQVPGHCLQQSEGLARTGLAHVSRGHCTFSQCTSPVVPCREGTGQSAPHALV